MLRSNSHSQLDSSEAYTARMTPKIWRNRKRRSKKLRMMWSGHSTDNFVTVTTEPAPEPRIATPIIEDSFDENTCVMITTSPPTYLTEEQVTAIKENIEEAVLTMLDKSISENATSVPIFEGKPRYHNGMLLLFSPHASTLTWLQEAVRGLHSPIPNTILVAVRNQGPGRYVKAKIVIPKNAKRTLDGLSIMQYFRAQNQRSSHDGLELGLASWKLQSLVGGEIDNHIIVGIPQMFVPNLLKRKNRLYYTIGNVYAELLETNNPLQRERPDEARMPMNYCSDHTHSNEIPLSEIPPSYMPLINRIIEVIPPQDSFPGPLDSWRRIVPSEFIQDLPASHEINDHGGMDDSERPVTLSPASDSSLKYELDSDRKDWDDVTETWRLYYNGGEQN